MTSLSEIYKWAVGYPYPIMRSRTTKPCEVEVRPYEYLAGLIESALASGAYARFNKGHLERALIEAWSPGLFGNRSGRSTVFARSFNQASNCIEVEQYAKKSELGLGSAFELVAFEMQYPEVVGGLTIISALPPLIYQGASEYHLVSSGPRGKRELKLEYLMSGYNWPKDCRWLFTSKPPPALRSELLGFVLSTVV